LFLIRNMIWEIKEQFPISNKKFSRKIGSNREVWFHKVKLALFNSREIWLCNLYINLNNVRDSADVDCEVKIGARGEERFGSELNDVEVRFQIKETRSVDWRRRCRGVDGVGSESFESRNKSSTNQLKNPKSEAADGTKKKKKIRLKRRITVNTIQIINKIE
jgi:hypothetical protein